MTAMIQFCLGTFKQINPPLGPLCCMKFYKSAKRVQVFLRTLGKKSFDAQFEIILRYERMYSQ